MGSHLAVHRAPGKAQGSPNRMSRTEHRSVVYNTSSLPTILSLQSPNLRFVLKIVTEYLFYIEADRKSKYEQDFLNQQVYALSVDSKTMGFI